ncbi:hypothetical protein BX260_7913 [Streptomyces sp. 5112.2]|nr:hypothetical protein BX260_7913 [Streptomyces sp. 5112.2]
MSGRPPAFCRPAGGTGTPRAAVVRGRPPGRCPPPLAADAGAWPAWCGTNAHDVGMPPLAGPAAALVRHPLSHRACCAPPTSCAARSISSGRPDRILADCRGPAGGDETGATRVVFVAPTAADRPVDAAATGAGWGQRMSHSSAKTQSGTVHAQLWKPATKKASTAGCPRPAGPVPAARVPPLRPSPSAQTAGGMPRSRASSWSCAVPSVGTCPTRPSSSMQACGPHQASTATAASSPKVRQQTVRASSYGGAVGKGHPARRTRAPCGRSWMQGVRVKPCAPIVVATSSMLMADRSGPTVLDADTVPPRCAGVVDDGAHRCTPLRCGARPRRAAR